MSVYEGSVPAGMVRSTLVTGRAHQSFRAVAKGKVQSRMKTYKRH